MVVCILVTMSKLIRLGKVAVLDTLGVILIIAAGLFGWAPGPGGIPLLLAGLSLLAINHKWAKDLLERIKREGFKLMDKIFNDHPAVKTIYDLASALFIGGALWAINTYTSNVLQTFAIMSGFFGLGLFLGNRKRLQNLVVWAKRSVLKRA